MRKLSLAVAAGLALALSSASAPHADRRQLPCGLPDQGLTAWIDFGWPGLAPIFAKPGVIVAVSSGDFPAQMRAAGAGTIHWDMNLKNRIGTPDAPADPATIVDRANRLFDYAVQQTTCATPLIAENELFGASLATPWSDTNEQYRANVLTYLRTLAERGAHPFLLVNSAPYTAGDAGDWWREVAKYADLVREVYPGAKDLYALGPVPANRLLRTSMRKAIADFTEIGIPTSKLGVMLGFQTTRGAGGRGGLQPAAAWFRVAKWQALSAKAIAKETRLATVWSWGWGEWTPSEMDPDKTAAACVWLWVRSPSLCDGPRAAGPDFDRSLAEGQIDLPGWAQCRVGKRTIGAAEIDSLARLTRDRDVAFAALFARKVESDLAGATEQEINAAERVVIAEHFSGRASDYRAALAAAGANATIARAILGDTLRRVRVERTLRVATPSAASVSTFYRSYPDTLARPVAAKPSPSWLGWRPSGWAFESIAPPAVFDLATGSKGTVRSIEGTFAVKANGSAEPLGALPLPVVASSIRSVLAAFARHTKFDAWTTDLQTAALRTAICRRDYFPVPGSVDLTDYLPFLSTTA